MTESEQLAAAQARIAELEGANQRAAKDAAINAALAGHDFASPAAAAQVAALIAPDIEIVNNTPVGPGLKSITAHVGDRLKDPSFSHFLKPRPGAPPSTTAVTAAPDAALSWDDAVPNEQLGAKILRRATAARTAGGADPRLNLAMPMGLRAR
jgi:hypothetical protein